LILKTRVADLDQQYDFKNHYREAFPQGARGRSVLACHRWQKAGRLVCQTGLMDLNPDTWGTFADWVGGIGTTLAFLATAAIIYRDSKVRREAQARKIAYYFREVDRSPEEVQGRYKK
jgi:hypothetical protein